MTRIEFTVMGNPVPWARARLAGKCFFTEPRVKAAKKVISLAAQLAFGRRAPWAGRIRVSLHFFRKTKQRCDIDRLASLPLDAMNAIVYGDDMQVCMLEASRYLDAKNPRTEIIVEELP